MTFFFSSSLIDISIKTLLGWMLERLDKKQNLKKIYIITSYEARF